MSTPLSIPRFRNWFLVSWLVWMLFHAALVHWYLLPLHLAALDSAIANALLLSVCILVSNILGFYMPSRQSAVFLLALTSVLTIIWYVLCSITIPFVLGSNEAFQHFYALSGPVRLMFGFLIIGCNTLLSVIYYHLQDQRDYEKRQEEAGRLAKDAELYLLRQQLQPHFLFNSLNSINALIGLHPQRARTMVHQLSDFLRGTLRRDEHQWSSLEEELQQLQLYLEIEKVRFGHRLDTEIRCDEQACAARLPSLLLQPLVENAIKFGLYDTTEAVTIRISGRMNEGLLHLQVENPYDPQTTRPRQGTGFGLRSVQRRLYLLFARNDLLVTRAEDGRFATTVKIPQS
ncbi:MAG TPA: histidine kinase [Chitinophagaceae bacterium]|nr:histidine kinase [Chitinophagaceae bacterium]